MAWNTFASVCVLLLLCALAKVEADPCEEILSSENGTGTFENYGGCDCSPRSFIFPGSVFYRLTVHIKRGCGHGTAVSAYTRPPGGNFIDTSLFFEYLIETEITALPGHDIRVDVTRPCGYCSASTSGRWLYERVKPSNWIVGHRNSSDHAELQTCANGGYRMAAGSCVCPPGFSGATCTDACGDDKYGDACERSCSEESGMKGQGCRGSIFCDPNKCFCAAGYEGPACDKRCEAGLYGANCTQQCGLCINGGSCDPTTGYCDDGCQLGYVPPLCREQLSHLRDAPHIIEVGSTFLKGSFKTGAGTTVGRGSVLFFQAQYKIKNNPDSIWVSAPLRRYSFDAVEGFQNFTLDNLPPDTDMGVRILLLDEQKRAFSSPPVAPVKTLGRRRVENLKVTSVSARSANFTWDSFDFKLGDYFFVRHECLSLLGCIGPCPHPAGIAIAAGPSIVLEGLLPAAMYRVTVEASDNHKEVATFATDFLPPDASVSSLRVAALTNSSAILEWSPSAQCEWVFGPATLYEWSLTPHGSKTGAGVSANTTATATVLTGLQPLTDYQFTVNLFNTEGRSPANRITAVNFSTHHTVPDPPRDLIAYRLNRTAVWLRWREPARPSGTLRAYVVDITPLKGDSLRGPPRLVRSERFPAGTHCAAWPDQVCHTVSRLRPQSRYSITVSAVNEHGDKPGEPASVEASTVKGVSEPPQDLRVVSQGKDFALVAWRLPNKINGDLLFFEVSVVRHVRADEESAETDVPDPDLQRISVSKELPEYQHRVEGLQPGATYSVTVNCGHSGQTSHLEVTTDEDTA